MSTEPVPVSGIALRHAVLVVLADAVRWEIRRGRVQRVGWGVYRIGHVPESTMRRAQRRMWAALDAEAS